MSQESAGGWRALRAGAVGGGLTAGLKPRLPCRLCTQGFREGFREHLKLTCGMRTLAETLERAKGTWRSRQCWGSLMEAGVSRKSP